MRVGPPGIGDTPANADQKGRQQKQKKQRVPQQQNPPAPQQAPPPGYHAPQQAPPPDLGQPPHQQKPPANGIPLVPPLPKFPSFRPNLTGPPTPALQHIGYWGSIQDFNADVQKHHDFFVAHNGGPPDKKTMMNLVLQDEHDRTIAAKAHKAIMTGNFEGIVSNGDLIKRPDGYLQRQNALCKAYPEVLNAIKVKRLMDKHPYIPMGALPMPPQLEEALHKAVDIINLKNPAARPLIMEGQDLKEYEKQTAIANEQPLSFLGKKGQEIRGRIQVQQNVTNVNQAQAALLKLAPDIFVDRSGHPLEPTGYINTDWSSAIKKYITTPQYFRQETRQLAQNNGYGNNTGAFISAWSKKQKALKDHPYFHQSIMAAPLFAFDGKNWASWKAALNQITGDPHGWNWLDVPSWAILHPLEYGGKEAFNTFGGAYDNVIADAAGDVKFFQSLSQGDTSHQAWVKAAKVMQENQPHAIDIFDPNYGGAPFKSGSGYDTKGGKLAIAVDLGLAFATGKPKFTGEFVKAGESAKEFRAFQYWTAWSFNDIKAGRFADAYSSLGKTKAGSALISHTQKLIKDGQMSLEEFQAKADDLIRRKRTEIPVHEKHEMETVYHGTMMGDVKTFDVKKTRAGKPIHEGGYPPLDDYGDAVYFTTKPEAASTYAEMGIVPKGVPYEGEDPFGRGQGYGHYTVSVPNVQIRRLPVNDFINTRLEDPGYVAGVRKKIESNLTEEELGRLGESKGWSDPKDANVLYRTMADTLGTERTNKAIINSGFHGLRTSEEERVVFNPEVIKPGQKDFVTISGQGTVMPDLQLRDIPTPGRMRLATKDIRRHIANAFKDFESGLQADAPRRTNITNHAVDFTSNVVGMLTKHATPPFIAIEEDRLPEVWHNWVFKNFGHNEELAREASNEMIVAQGSGNVAAVENVYNKWRQRFLDENPSRQIQADAMKLVGDPTLDTETKTYLYLPNKLVTNAQEFNQALNKYARLHREALVAGPYAASVAWKHTFADTARRLIGGGFTLNKAEERRIEREILFPYLRENLDAANMYSVESAAAREGEFRWVEGSTEGDPHDFMTGAREKVMNGRVLSPKQWQKAAGGYLRRHLSSNAIRAYMRSTEDDLDPLTAYLLQSRDFRTLMFNEDSFKEERQALMEQFKPLEGPDPWGFRLSPKDLRILRDQKIKELERRYAQIHAQAVYNHFREIEHAGRKINRPDILEEALNVRLQNLGARSDEVLGKWIADNKLDFPVHRGLVPLKRKDAFMSDWIKVLMTANKWNRSGMFRSVLLRNLKTMIDEGIKIEDALPAAIDLSRRQTYYHMLDFSNMLEAEQRLRWVSYFMTKRRLYWKWIFSTAVHRPGTVVIAHELDKYLDPKGNLNFNLFGWRLSMPLARLFWLNDMNSTYPEVSPILEAGAKSIASEIGGHGLGNPFALAAGTSGNVFTRDDQTIMMAIKLGRMETGNMPATTDAVTSDMGPLQKLFFNEAVNKYAVFYYHQHGHWPSEADAVKHTLLSQVAQSYWQNNLPLPVTWNDPSATTPALQKQIDTYHHIASPTQARDYLDSHPDVALRVGISEDPAVFIQTSKYWSEYNAARKELDTKQTILYRKAQQGDTVDFLKGMSKIANWWSKTVNQLKLEDAKTWQGNAQFPKGEISDGQITTSGPFGVQLEGDPAATQAFVHQMFPKINQANMTKYVIGQNFENLSKEAAQIRKAGTSNQKLSQLGFVSSPYSGTAYEQARTRLSEIEQTISPFFGMPRTPAQSLENEYYSKYVGPYVKKRDAWRNRLKTAQAGDPAYAKLKAWMDAQDHPIKVTKDGHTVTFPSPVRVGFLMLTPGERHKDLAQAIAGQWQHLGSYQKDQLGVKTKPGVEKGWALFDKTVATYEASPATSQVKAAQKMALAKGINRRYPGFLYDYLFSLKPKAERFSYTNLYKQIPDKQYFDAHIMKQALLVAKYMSKPGNYEHGLKVWKYWVKTTIEPQLEKHPILKRELENYGPHFLDTLVEAQ